jgi:hypothetical protein
VLKLISIDAPAMPAPPDAAFFGEKIDAVLGPGAQSRAR